MIKKENEEVGYGYYSKLLNKPFDSIDELKEAEDEYNKEHEAELAKAREKKSDAHEVENAYKNYIKTVEETNKHLKDVTEMIRKQQEEVYNEYIEAKNKFIDKHGSFHMTYVNKEPKVDTNDTIKNVNKLLETSWIDLLKSLSWF